MGRDSTVGIATCYGLDGLGIEYRGGGFSAPVQNGPWAHLASYTMGTGTFLRVKWPPGFGNNHLPPSSAMVKERVDLYLYPPPRAFMACYRVYFTFTFYLAPDNVNRALTNLSTQMS